MKQFILLFSLLMAISSVAWSQTIQGGAGVCHVNGDPNVVIGLTTQDVRSECLVVVDTTNDTRIWYYKHDATSGSRWQLLDLSASDTDTRIQNPRVSNDTLLFDLFNVKTSTVIGSEFVLVGDIAPVQSVVGSTGIGVNTVAGTATVSPANDLAALESIATLGMVARIASETYATRALTGTGAIQVTNGDGVAGNPTIDIAQQGATNGQVLEWNGSSWAPGTDDDSGGTVTSVGLTSPSDGLSVAGSPITTSGSFTLDLAGDLAAVEGIATTGIAVRTATNTWLTRSVTGGTGVTVTNGNGVAGNLTVAFTEVEADSQSDAAANGVAVGEYFYASLTNTMGLAPGTKVKRMY